MNRDGLDALRDALRYELLRVRTIRSTRTLLAVGALVSALTTAALCVVVTQAGSAATAAGATESLAVALTRSPAAVVVAGLLGVMALGHDYKYATLSTTLLVTPHRRTAFLARALVLAGSAGLLGVVSLLLGWGVVTVGLGPDVVARASLGPLLLAQLGFLVFVVGWSLVGLALVGLLRNQTGAVLALLLWPFVVEPTARAMSTALGGGPLGHVVDHLPYAAGQALSNVPAAGAESLFSAEHASSPLVALSAFVLAIGAVATVATVGFVRRPTAA